MQPLTVSRNNAIAEYERLKGSYPERDNELKHLINRLDDMIIVIEVDSFGNSDHKRYFDEKQK